MKLSRIAAVAATIGLLAIAALSAGCAGSSPPAAAKGGTITGVEWQLDTLNGAQAPAGPRPVNAVFEAKNVSGFSGVNSYSGPYTANADGSIRIGPLASTMMAGGPEAMQLESGYLKALQSAATYLAADGRLTRYSAEGVPIVVYKANEAAQAGLPGTKWSATNYNNGKQAVVGLEASSSITADFGKDGKLSGNASVNQYSASYEATESGIRIGPTVSTKMAGPANLMAQEAAYLAALEKAVTWKISGGRLELRASDGALQAMYEPAK